MASLTFDKKQLPQVIALGALTLGAFGFFAMKIFVPPPTQAAAPAPAPSKPGSSPLTTGASTQGSSGGSAASNAAAANADPDTTTLIGADAPTDSMRDPFIAPSPLPTDTPAVTPAPKAPQIAGASVPSIPGLGQIKPLPLPGEQGVPGMASIGQGVPAAPVSWQLMGIIQSDNDPSNAIAILRDPNTHRYLRLGEKLDSDTKLVGIDKSSITLSRSGHRVQLGISSTIEELGASAGSGGMVQSPQVRPASPVPTPILAAPMPESVLAPNPGAPLPGDLLPGGRVPATQKTTDYSHGAAD